MIKAQYWTLALLFTQFKGSSTISNYTPIITALLGGFCETDPDNLVQFVQNLAHPLVRFHMSENNTLRCLR